MEELFLIESNIGEIAAIFSATAFEDEETFEIHDWIQKVEFVEEAPKPKQLDEDGNEIEEEEAPPEEVDDKKPKWNPGDFVWSVTNNRLRNFAQIFKDVKGSRATMEVIKEEESAEWMNNCIDKFLARVVEDNG